MANSRVNTIKSTIAKQTKNTARAHSAKTPSGPTIGGVAGVGVATTPKRPKSSREPSIAHAHHTGLSASGLGEGKESEATANRQLGQTARMRMIKAYYKPKHTSGGMNDYYAHNAKATSQVKEEVLDEDKVAKIPVGNYASWKAHHNGTGYVSAGVGTVVGHHKTGYHVKDTEGFTKSVEGHSTNNGIKEETLNEVKVGDHVHIGHGVKGGVGVRGHVTAVIGTTVHIKQHADDAKSNAYGPRSFQGPISRTTVEKSVNEEVLDEARKYVRMWHHDTGYNQGAVMGQTEDGKVHKVAKAWGTYAKPELAKHAKKHGLVDSDPNSPGYEYRKPKVNEEAPSMSVGGGAIAGVAPPDATVDYAAQLKRRKIDKVKALARRKKPVGE